MEQKRFVNLKEPIAGGLNKLSVSVKYAKAGVNYFFGEIDAGGIYVYLQPCTYENGVTGTKIDGKIHTMGFKYLVKQMGRKSQKQIDIISSLVLPHAEEIAALYEKEDYTGAIAIIKNACANIK